MQLKEIIEEFLLELDIRGASKKIIRSYTNSLKIFSDYIGEIEAEKIKAVHIKGFVKFNKDIGLKRKTQNTKWIYISCKGIVLIYDRRNSN
ncbi:hypothetical protein GKD14_16285 [Paeniclostridium sordellii]|nr:hypothetical protein [Paeniclostridium sordellii]MSB60500.1 hypothetical protein [Paeniclostridium sordellii]